MKNRLALQIFLLFIAISFAFGQKIDFNALYKSTNLEISNKNFSNALLIAEQGLNYAKNETNNEFVGKFYFLLGIIHQEQQNAPLAIENLVKSIHVFELNSIQSNVLGEAYLQLARIYHQMMAYNQAEIAYRNAYSNFANSNNSVGKGKAYLGLTASLSLADKYEKVLPIYGVLLDSLNQFRLNSDERKQVIIGNLTALVKTQQYKLGIDLANKQSARNEVVSDPTFHYLIGRCYFHLTTYEKAISSFETALKLKPNNITFKVWLAESYREVGNLVLAEKFFQELIKPANSVFQEDIIKAYNGLANIKIKQSRFDEAVIILNNAEQIARENKVNVHLETTYELLILLFDLYDEPTEVSKYKFLLRSLKKRISDDEQKQIDLISVNDNLALKLERQFRTEVFDLQNATKDETLHADLPETDIKKEQIAQQELQEKLQITRQLQATQLKDGGQTGNSGEFQVLKEIENEQLLELSKKEKLILQQQFQLQQTLIEASKQRQQLFVIIIAISLGGVGLLALMMLRISASNKIISKQNNNLEIQKDELKKAQLELTKTLENEQKFRKSLQNANLELKETQSQLIHAEKMSSLGQLTAGIFHEINNPINFVKGGIETLDRNFQQINLLLKEVAEIKSMNDLSEEDFNDLKSRIQEELEYTQEFAPQIVKDMMFGTSRIEDIVNSLKIFSRQAESKSEIVSLHEIINSSIVILKRKIENTAEIIKDYDSSIEKIECFPGQLNQVFVNMISNALDAMITGHIKITTKDEGEKVSISIKDNGVGMNKDVIQHIFEPFYTTKEVGKGTGLGLAISYSIIQKHQGSIKVFSEVGKGTEFIITLPKEIVAEESITKKVSNNLKKSS